MSQFAQNAPGGPVFDPVLENFHPAGGRTAAPPTLPATFPHDISTPKNKNEPLINRDLSPSQYPSSHTEVEAYLLKCLFM